LPQIGYQLNGTIVNDRGLWITFTHFESMYSVDALEDMINK